MSSIRNNEGKMYLIYVGQCIMSDTVSIQRINKRKMVRFAWLLICQTEQTTKNGLYPLCIYIIIYFLFIYL